MVWLDYGLQNEVYLRKLELDKSYLVWIFTVWVICL